LIAIALKERGFWARLPAPALLFPHLFLGDRLRSKVTPMQEPAHLRRAVKFGVFEADLAARELRKNGVKIRLQEQPFQVLALLLENRGEVMTREELRQKLWPADTFVDFDNGLNTAINKIREALCDSAESPRYVETLPRRGYRFIGQSEQASGKIQSLVVLPLENLSRDPEQEYFADGLTEALITNLAKISALRVVSRTTAMQYKGARKTVPEIVRELGVDAIVEGTVQRFGERACVSAQLVQASTDTHLWAESYERDLRDMMTLQAELARAIASEIQVKLTPQEQMQLARVRQVEPEAYDCYLKGRYHWNKRTLEGLTKAMEHFQEAIERDPTYAGAHAGLADSASRLGWWIDLAPEEGCLRGKAAALKAIELDKTLAEGHAALWFPLLSFDYNISAAEEAVERAIELDPQSAFALQGRACCLMARGRAEESFAEALRAARLEPFTMVLLWNAALFGYIARQYDEAIELCQRGLDLDPKFAPFHWTLGLVYVQRQSYGQAVEHMEEAVRLSHRLSYFLGGLGHVYGAVGRREDALQIVGELEERCRQRHVSPYWTAMIYAALDDKDATLLWLERAREDHAPWVIYLKSPPWFDNLRSDSRYYRLLQRMNIPV
jgi:TolB-like protein